MFIASAFIHDDIPINTLTPKITIYKIPDTTEFISLEDMNSIGGGWYFYNFIDYVPSEEYLFTIDGGVELHSTERYQFGGNESFYDDIKSLTDPIQLSVDSIDSTGLQGSLSDLSVDMTSLMGATQNIENKVDSVATDTSSVIASVSVLQNSMTIVQADLKRVLGLMHENIFIDNPIYDGNNNMIGARIRIYSNPASTGSSNNIIGTYEITVTPDGPGRFTEWKQIKI